MNKKLFVYNIALRRQDGAVERDTVYRENLMTREEVEDMSNRFSCDVIMSCVGTYKCATEDFIKENTFCVELPKPQDVDKSQDLDKSQVIAEDAALDEELSDCDVCGLCEDGGGC